MDVVDGVDGVDKVDGVDTMDVKLEMLFALLREINVEAAEKSGGPGGVAVGYSGGVDSSFLLAAAVRALGRENVLAITASSPSMPHGEKEAALGLAKQLGVMCRVVTPGETEDPDYIANPPERCYICKRIIFRRISLMALEYGCHIVLDGDNADDASEHRPGRRAARELGVRSPLAEAGFTKAEIRAVSKEWGLPTADKPALACLATRVPHGTRITPEMLGMIGRAEAALRVAGFAHCRVRHHGDVARIEVAPGEIAKLAADGTREKIAEGVRAAGYKHVAVDLEGYGKERRESRDGIVNDAKIMV